MTKVFAAFQGDCSKHVVQQLRKNGQQSLIVVWKVRLAALSMQQCDFRFGSFFRFSFAVFFVLVFVLVLPVIF